jgi:hypothetical protein
VTGKEDELNRQDAKTPRKSSEAISDFRFQIWEFPWRLGVLAVHFSFFERGAIG